MEITSKSYLSQLAFPTRYSNIAGINSDGSGRSSDMLMKIQHISKNSKGGVVMATATPVSNSIAELYTMNRYLKPKELKDKGIYSFDAWIKTFATKATEEGIDPTGEKSKVKDKFKNFNNIPELMKMYLSFAHTVNKDKLGAKVPKLKENKRIAIECEPDDNFLQFKEVVKEKLDSLQNGSKNNGGHLVLFNQSKLGAIDMRFLGNFEKNENGKIQICANKISEIYNETSNKKSTQAVFSDVGTPSTKGNFSLYKELESQLIKLGIPKNQIAFAQSFNTEESKKEMMDKVKSGEIRVVIGSTKTLGTGTNIQDKLVALHHLDVPYRPSDIEQREGRAIRQGNENEEVGIYSYTTKGSIESYLYQILESKQKFISVVSSGNQTNIRTIDDCDEVTLSFSELKALTMGNMLIQKKMDLENEITRLLILKDGFINEQKLAKHNFEQIPKHIHEFKNNKETINQAIDLSSGSNKIILGGSDFSNEKKDAIGEKIHSLTANSVVKEENINQDIKIGQYKNLDLYVVYKSFTRDYEYKLKLDDNVVTSVDNSQSPLGLVTRIDNAIKNLPQINTRIDEKINRLEDSFESVSKSLNNTFPHDEQISKLRVEKLHVEQDLKEQMEEAKKEPAKEIIKEARIYIEEEMER